MKLLKKFKGMSKIAKVATMIVAIPAVLFTTIFVSAFTSAFASVSGDSSETVEATNTYKVKDEYCTAYEELLDVIVTNDILVLKAKIDSGSTNEMTVKYNTDIVKEFISKNNISGVSEIQYWAVADMTYGKDSKVISFTLNESTINAIKNKASAVKNLIPKAEDVWIHPSLNN
ncbi:MAG: hypothetical protein IJ086_00600 [Clostridium sp.]|nr:hypothetical protein [Clostridium sp.]